MFIFISLPAVPLVADIAFLQHNGNVVLLYASSRSFSLQYIWRCDHIWHTYVEAEKTSIIFHCGIHHHQQQQRQQQLQ